MDTTEWKSIPFSQIVQYDHIYDEFNVAQDLNNNSGLFIFKQ